MPVPYKCLECASNLQLKLIFDEDILRFESCKVCKDKSRGAGLHCDISVREKIGGIGSKFKLN